MVLAVKRPMIMIHKTKSKFKSRWEGPFMVRTVYLNEAYHLINLDDDRMMMPINGNFLKKYYIY